MLPSHYPLPPPQQKAIASVTQKMIRCDGNVLQTTAQLERDRIEPSSLGSRSLSSWLHDATEGNAGMRKRGKRAGLGAGVPFFLALGVGLKIGCAVLHLCSLLPTQTRTSNAAKQCVEWRAVKTPSQNFAS